MSFVSKGEKQIHNKAKGASKGGDRPAVSDSFGKRGHKVMHNATVPSSKNESAVTEGEDYGEGYSADKTVKSEYDPASGKRAKSIADLRNAVKLLNEKSDAGENSPVGGEDGQEGKHSTSKNAGPMKGKQVASKVKPRGLASQESDEGEDPMDTDMEENEQTHEGFTPKGQSRKSSKALKTQKKRIVNDEEWD